MFKFIRRLVVIGLLVGAGYAGLRALGLVGQPGCGITCECSYGATSCDCGHDTCLAPAAA